MEDRTPLAPRSRRRGMPARLATPALVVVLVTAVVSCSGGDDDTKKRAPTTTRAPATRVIMSLGDVSADSAGPPATVSPAQTQSVISTLTKYVNGATVQPLRSGQPATANLGEVFDPATLATATTTDRGVVLDEGLPAVTGDLDVSTTPVALVGLGDQSGNVILINASFVMDAKGTTKIKGTPLHVVRRVDLVLQPDPTGTWKITAYNVFVSRDGADLSPTTTTATATTKGTRR